MQILRGYECFAQSMRKEIHHREDTEKDREENDLE